MSERSFKLTPFSAKVVIVCTIVGLTLFAYCDIQHHQFLNFDDNVYVSANPYVKNGFSLEGIRWAFTFTDVSYWQPLAMLSHMMDCQIFGVKPRPHLLVNLSLHILNAILLFLVMLRMTGARFKAALVAVLFAVHPLNVESVSWLAERKTVLSTFFFLTAIYTYIDYTESKRKWKYAVLLCLYALGLMSKASILTLPFLLLVLDYWPLKRFGALDLPASEKAAGFAILRHKWISFCKSDAGKIILEKAPLFTLSLLSVFVTMASVLVHQRFYVDSQLVPIYLRIENLFVSIIRYLGYMAWPVELSIFYPFHKSIPVWQFLLALVIVVLITLGTFMLRKNRPWLIAGWLWFLIALAPASGLIQAGLWPAIANRFMYLPMIGIFMMIAWEGDQRLQGRYSRSLKVILCATMLIFFTSLTRVQNVYFSNSFALFNRCLEVVGENQLALNNLGEALASLGRTDEAISYFARSIKFDPTQADAHHNYGVSLVAKKDDLNAIPHFLKAIALNPNHINSHIHLGLIQSRRGYNDEAIKLLEKALEIDKENLAAHNNMGTFLSNQGKHEQAIPHFAFVLKKDPSNLPVRINLSQAYEEAGLYEKAITEYEALLKTTTKNKAFIYYRLAGIYSKQNKFKECEDYLETAIHNEGFDVFENIKKDKNFEYFRKTSHFDRFLAHEIKHH